MGPLVSNSILYKPLRILFPLVLHAKPTMSWLTYLEMICFGDSIVTDRSCKYGGQSKKQENHDSVLKTITVHAAQTFNLKIEMQDQYQVAYWANPTLTPTESWSVSAEDATSACVHFLIDAGTNHNWFNFKLKPHTKVNYLWSWLLFYFPQSTKGPQ